MCATPCLSFTAQVVHFTGSFRMLPTPAFVRGSHPVILASPILCGGVFIETSPRASPGLSSETLKMAHGVKPQLFYVTTLVLGQNFSQWTLLASNYPESLPYKPGHLINSLPSLPASTSSAHGPFCVVASLG